MSTEKELLTAFVSKTLSLDETGVASLYNEDGSALKTDALETLLKLDVERVSKLKPDTKKFFDDGYKKAQSEIMPKFEKDFKEKTGFQSEKKGVELVLEYAAKKQEGGEITEDVIKKHPLYISTVEKLSSEKEIAVKAEQDKLTQFQTELKKKETFSSVESKAKDIFKSFKPILSTNPEKAKNQESDFVNKMNGYEYELQEDRIIVLKDGKMLEDAHGNRIPFEKVVKETAEKYYDFHITDPKSAPGNGKTGSNEDGGKTFNFQAPKNEQEYAAFIADSSKPVEERTAYKEAYQKNVIGTN